jgi:hypothetical protein
MIRIIWMLLVLDHSLICKKMLSGNFLTVSKRMVKDGKMTKEGSQV